MHAVEVLRSMVNRVPSRLQEISDSKAALQRGPDQWSAKQELGHLLDSAIMNHVRLLRVLTEDNPDLGDYNGEYCVKAHNYRQRDWSDLIATWERLNAHFLMAAEGVSNDLWNRPCNFVGKPVTLEFLFTDYVRHALHHLRHIGVSVDEFSAKA
jgi:hypothetical protein